MTRIPSLAQRLTVTGYTVYVWPDTATERDDAFCVAVADATGTVVTWDCEIVGYDAAVSAARAAIDALTREAA